MIPNNRLRCCVISIRSDWTPEIFETRTKFFEYRSWFEPDFRGRCYVYECGTKSRHKVIGFFDTASIIKIEPNKELPPAVHKMVEKIPMEAAAELLEAPYDMEPQDKQLFAIPIFKPRMFYSPLGLSDFASYYKTAPYFSTPPRSWMKFMRPMSIQELPSTAPTFNMARPTTNKTPTEVQLDLFNQGGNI